MKIVRATLLAIVFASLAAACGGKNKNDSTMENKGGDMSSGSDMGSGGDMYGGTMYGDTMNGGMGGGCD